MEKFKGVGINPELPVVLIITIILLLGGIALLYFEKSSNFNFYSSKISVNGAGVQEELHYKPNKEYHTLYRNFVSEVYWGDSSYISSKNYMLFSNIQCSSGNSYLRDYNGRCYNSTDKFNCLPYTEQNEYGCTFGDVLGFSKGKEYTINAEYVIHPENLFKINNNYYIKFVAYSPDNHIKLTEENFVVEGNAIRDEKYFPNQNVIIYIPYTGDRTGFNIIEKENFEFDSDFGSILKSLLVFFPGIIFFLVWFIFGKENVYEQTPKELSTFPSERKFWEVSAYFNPPFLKIDKNLFAAVLLNFYNKKIIDIKEKEDEIYIKLNKFEGEKIERQIYNLLGEAEGLLKEKAKKDSFDGEYFNFKKAMRNQSLAEHFLTLRNDIKDEGKKYLRDNSGITILVVLLSCFFVYLLNSSLNLNIDIEFGLDLWYIIVVFISIIMLPLTLRTLFIKYKENYYIEYQRWKAFKRYLKNSFSIKTATHKTIVIWNEYLIYATALGVPDKVIKELKANNIIDDRQMNIYNGVIIGSSSVFSSGSTGAGFSGGFGGAGGGGSGGGGGGGR